MARTIERLNKKFVDSVQGSAKSKKYGDGQALYLVVSDTGAKTWLFRYPDPTKPGHTKRYGLGSAYDLTLADTREQAAKYRKQVRFEGLDPIEERKKRRADARAERAKVPTFGECADAYIDTHSPSWSNAVHRRQWRQTLDDYVIPHIGDCRVDTIDAKMIVGAVKDLWTSRPETGRRVQARIENILQYATSIEARTGEVIGAIWNEVDLANKTWTIPASRMKAKREHRGPLADAAVEVLTPLKPIAMRGGEAPSLRAPLFPGWRGGTHLSNMAMTSVLKRMDRGDITVHGMRSAFRDWVSEATDYQGEVAEAALAHTVGDKVEAAYGCGDLFTKRTRLMADWARYCFAGSAPANDAAEPERTGTIEQREAA